MKIGQPTQGSFGIPPHMQEAIDRARDEKRTQSGEQNRAAEEPPAEEVKQDNEKFVEDNSPENLLKKIGTTLEDKDLDSLIFKGFVEKELAPIMGRLKPTLKTLTSEEYDFVDELLAEEIDTTKMTRDGVEIRRQMWVLAFSVTKINGKPLTKAPVMKEKEIDLKATAKEKRAVLSKLAPAVVDKLFQYYNFLYSALRAISDNPGGILKNS